MDYKYLGDKLISVEHWMLLPKLPLEKVIVSCMVCGTQWLDEPPRMCCSGRECGCMGLPIEPILCSKECGEKLFNKTNLTDTKLK